MEVGAWSGRRFIVLHGWDDDPTGGWLGWLQELLRSQGAQVLAPRFPTIRHREDILTWNQALQDLISAIAPGDTIVAHSLGCWQALRALEACDIDGRVDKVILVSGFYDAPDERASAFFQPEPDWTRLKIVASEYVCILSRDDTIVRPARTRSLASMLDARLVEMDGLGHFLGSRGMNTFPELLSYLA